MSSVPRFTAEAGFPVGMILTNRKGVHFYCCEKDDGSHSLWKKEGDRASCLCSLEGPVDFHKTGTDGIYLAQYWKTTGGVLFCKDCVLGSSEGEFLTPPFSVLGCVEQDGDKRTLRVTPSSGDPPYKVCFSS